jgi:3-oxoacyl-[acyl-carrier-protein] synthase I
LGKLNQPLHIVGSGAVTAAGLTAAQTCAAFRAGLTGFEFEMLSDPFGAEQVVARIPSNWRLKRDPAQWIINLAVRAIRETFADAQRMDEASPERTALFLTPPESGRAHPCYDHVAPREFLDHVLSSVGMPFHPASRAFDGGAAAGLGALSHASELIARRTVDHVILAGADSLLNPVDLARLAAQNRLAAATNSQGVVPGEGAAAVCLSNRAPINGTSAACVILSIGSAIEADSVLTENFSQGRAMLTALKEAGRDGDADGEPLIDFVLSNANGERYAALETLITRSRFYRTRRERTPVAYPAMAAGETGAASAALALVIARDAFALGYAPGQFAMAEIASDHGLRCAAMIRSGAVRR